MMRRDLLKLAPAAAFAAERAGNRVAAEVVRLKLKHTWTTTMSSSEFRDNVYVSWAAQGITGRGEGAPIVRYKENAIGAKKIIDEMAPSLAGRDPWQFSRILREAFAKIPGEYGAKAALDIALTDWATQKAGLPLYKYLGLDAGEAPITTFSIGIDTPEITKQKVLEADPFPVLKIKVGLDRDEATMEAVRSVTKKPLRLDANEGFKTKEEAVRKINWLEGLGAQFIEQPMAAHLLDEQRWVRSRVLALGRGYVPR